PAPSPSRRMEQILPEKICPNAPTLARCGCMKVYRRNFLALAVAGAALALARPARAGSKPRVVAEDARGLTLAADLEHAPFPAQGAAYQDRTVFVFVPAHYTPPRDGRVSMVVHFHGHNTTAERAMAAHELREQLFDSKQNAILVVPQGPVFAAD